MRLWAPATPSSTHPQAPLGTVGRRGSVFLRAIWGQSSRATWYQDARGTRKRFRIEPAPQTAARDPHDVSPAQHGLARGGQGRKAWLHACVRAWVHQWIYTTRAVTANGSRKTEGWSRNVARMGRRQLRSVPALSLENARPGRPSPRDLPKSTCVQALCGETPFSNAVINFFKKMFQLFRLKGRAPGAPRTARWSFILRPVSVRTFPTTLGERPARVKFKTTRPQGSRRRQKADLRHTGRRTDVARASAGPRNGTHEPGHATRTEGVFRPRRGRIA